MNPLLMPVVAAQALWLRSTVRAAPEPDGPATGRERCRSGPPLRIAVVGESTAAGCGVARHDEGFIAALAADTADRTGSPVAWEAVGRYGATARRIRDDLVPRLGGGLNLVVVLAGVNDVLTRNSPDRWRHDLGGILSDLTGRAGRIVVAGVPPFTLFPSIPATLAGYLAERAAALDAVSRDVCAGAPDRFTFVAAPAGETPPGFFATDRFHPSAAGYRYWAGIVADHLTD